MKDSERLTDKQERYAQYLAAGMESQAAAKKAGYSDSFARVAAFRMKHKPSVAKAIDAIQAEGRKLAVYDLAKAMDEAADVIAFAKQHKHPTAYFFAVRHRAHLSGLLIDRVEIATVDLTGALARAEQRVLNQTPQPLSLESREPIDWRPHIPGSRNADREAGPADGESEAEAESARRIGK